MQKLFAVAVAGAASMLYGNEIMFTGLDSSNPTNLSSSANWSAPPSADVVGVIDLSKTSAAGYVADGDVALKGLRIKANGSKKITIGGAGVLTVGSSGYEQEAKGTLDLKCPLATVDDQVWHFNQGDFSTSSTISGSHTLVISNYTWCTHNATVNYDGTLKYYAYSSAANKWVSYRGTGKWATHVITASTQSEIWHYRSGETRYADIFPSGCEWTGNGSPRFLSVTGSSSGYLVFDDGDTLTVPPASMLTGVAGRFEQRGGELTASDKGHLVVGYANGVHVGTWPEWAGPSIYRMKGGTLKTADLLVGYANKDTTGENVRFEQTGGTVTIGINNTYGGGVRIAGGGTCVPTAVAEYSMGGGTLNALAYGNSANLALCSPLTSGSVSPAALYTQTGGTANVRWMCLGAYKSGTWRDGSSPSVNDGFARFELSGGTMVLQQKDWLQIHPGWNNKAATSNSVYSFNFGGGSMKMPTDTRWHVATRFPSSGTGAEWGEKESGSADISIVAPVSGSGTLVKKGTGGLFLTDATRFTGTLDVRGGVVSVDGGAEDIGASDVGCFRWTADSLAATLANGDKVTDWTDVNAGVTATTNGNRVVEIKKLDAPTFKASAYNGHAAVTFSGNSLAVPQAENPLYGKNRCTVVAVIKPTASTTWYLRYGKVVLSMMGSQQYGWMSIGGVAEEDGASGWRLGVGRRFGGTTESTDTVFKSRSGVSMNDGDIHAFAVTIDAEKVSFTVDGDYTNAVWTGGTAADVAPFGYGNKNWTPGDKGELFIGGHIVDNVDGASFAGDILELRVYTNRLFTVAEQKQVTKKLLQVYDGTQKRMTKFEKFVAPMGTPCSFKSWTAPAPVETAASWDADTIDAADGATIEEWFSEAGEKVASVPSGKSAPVLVKNAINGHSALRFSAADKTAFGISKDNSPISGAKSFTAALVWRTREKGTGTSIMHENSAAGLISTKQASAKSADMAITYRSGSAVMAGYGHSIADQSISTRKPCRLNDGEPHISILSCDGDGKTYKLMTDGVFFEGSLANVSERGAFDVMIGALKAGSSSATEFFTGDIAAVKLYGSALTKEQMRNLGEYWAKKYATQLLVGYAFDESKLRETGLGATNIIVAADARLSLPLTDETPFTLGAGSRLAGAGCFMGSYRFIGGSTLDLTQSVPSMFDDLQMAGGAIRVDRTQMAENSARLHVRRIKAGTGNFVVVDGTGEMPRKTVLFTFDEADIPEDATWTVSGDRTTLTSVVVDHAAKCAILKTQRGFTVNIR